MLSGYSDATLGKFAPVAPVTFGSVALDNPATQTLTLTNSGGSDITLATFNFAALELLPPLEIDGNTTCVSALVLKSGASCQIVINFAATPAGVYAQTLKLNYHDGASNKILSVKVTASVDPIAITTVAGVNLQSSDGIYPLTQIIDIRVNFSENVTVDTSGGIPRWQFETGTIDRYATYLSGTGTTTLTFRYTVQAGDLSGDLDYTTATSLEANGGTIRDPAGNDATLTLPAVGTLAAAHAIVVDGEKPTVTMNQKLTQNDPTDNLPIEFAVVFNGPINAATFTVADISQDAAATSSVTAWTITNSGDDTNFVVKATVIATEGTVIPILAEGVVQDLAGNGNQASTSSDNTVTYSTFCPFDDQYIEVPGNAALDTPNFCVMKFEAKNVGGIATSQAAGNPWVGINQTDSKTACTDLGAEYDLISNREWLTIAYDLENVAANWSAGSVASGHLNRGWSASLADDGFANTAVAPSTSAACLYNTAADTCDSTGVFKFKRTHTLSNGEVIWDLAGNVWEWTDWTLGGALASGPTSCATPWMEFPVVSCGALPAADYMPGNPGSVAAANYNSNYGLGRFYGGAGGGARRGGYWGGGANAGAFALHLNGAVGGTTGFRCVYRPGATVTVNQTALQGDPTNSTPIAFEVTFSKPIDPATFAPADITQNGTATGITWQINNSGDDQNFTLEAVAITGEGTVVPFIGVNTVQDSDGYNSYASTSSDSSVIYSTFCPFDNQYIEVPGNAVLGTPNFCVMKFEAKNVGGIATSQAAGGPWAGLNQTSSKTACTALGSGYDLISNPEWMTIAYDVEVTASNWDGGVVGSSALYRGHTDNGPPSALAVTNPADPYDGTGNNAGEAMGSGKEQKRTFTLSNGKIIWDLSGNILEWTDWTLGGALASGPTSCGAGWTEFPIVSCGALAAVDYMPGNPGGVAAANYNANYGLGRFYGGVGGATFRGGYWGNGSDSGAFSLNLANASTLTDAYVGFRCVYRPGAIVTVNQTALQGDPTNSTPIAFEVTFSKPIDPATFAPADITQNGTATGITWQINNSGDDQNFTLEAVAITGEGTVIPFIGVNTVQDSDGHNSYASTSSDSSVTYSTFCPFDDQYIEVPGNAVLGTSSFCVMKYEARDVGGIATSQATDFPWGNITQTNSKTACTALGVGYDLISNPEWMTIARNVEATASNWDGGVVGSSALYRGHSDNAPGSALTITNTADPYDSTGDNVGEAMGSGREQKRTYTFSNGAVIWDFAGNVYEWADWTLGGALTSGPTTCAAGWTELPVVSCGAMVATDYMPDNPAGVTPANYNSTYGLGLFYGNTGGAALRGGYWNAGTLGGPFGMNLNVTSGFANAYVGFRCVFRP